MKRSGIICALLLVAGFILAQTLFVYADNIPLSKRIRGDALHYLQTASEFNSLQQALTFTGDRTYGYPLFLFIIQRLFFLDNVTDWMAALATAQLLIHLGAALLFYAFFLKPLRQRAPVAATAVAALLLAYPAAVTYTSVPLTDVLSLDLVMISAGIAALGDQQNKLTSRLIARMISGITLGYLIMVRPSFWPAVAAYLLAGLVISAFRRKPQLLLSNCAGCVGALLILIPSLLAGRAAFGSFSLQNPEFVRKSSLHCLQKGLYTVRVYWSLNRYSAETLPGVRDPYLLSVYRESAPMESMKDFCSALLRQPGALPFYLLKKSAALFDVPYVQPYFVEETPGWFTSLQRLFQLPAFAGFLALLLTLFLKIKPCGNMPWIGWAWSAFLLVYMMTHGIMHIEGRYGFALLPFSLASLFFGWLQVRGSKRAAYVWAVLLLTGTALFCYQLLAWDRVTPV